MVCEWDKFESKLPNAVTTLDLICVLQTYHTGLQRKFFWIVLAILNVDIGAEYENHNNNCVLLANFTQI